MILSEVVYKNPTIIPILSRFGISLGLGDMSVSEVTEKYNLDTDFFLLVLNTYLNEDYYPQMELKGLNSNMVAQYLSKTRKYYLEVQLPNIEKHLNAFIGMSMAIGGNNANNPLMLLKKLLDNFKASLLVDENNNDLENTDSLQPHQILQDMQEVLIKFLQGNYNHNLCYATIFAMHSLELDIVKHIRIRKRVLHKITEVSRELTPREIEVLRLVVAGKLNKEIAGDLNISFQTVLSHRKNITSKLGVKTVSGLTFYAISNGIVEMK
ncbi:MAG: LuxR C-terminal-related transcriptional regulator [Bacteroidales bacterium]